MQKCSLDNDWIYCNRGVLRAGLLIGEWSHDTRNIAHLITTHPQKDPSTCLNTCPLVIVPISTFTGILFVTHQIIYIGIKMVDVLLLYLLLIVF